MTKSDHKNVITKTTTHKIYLQRFIPWKNPKSDHKIYLQRFIPWKNPNTAIYQKNLAYLSKKTCRQRHKNITKKLFD